MLHFTNVEILSGGREYVQQSVARCCVGEAQAENMGSWRVGPPHGRPMQGSHRSTSLGGLALSQPTRFEYPEQRILSENSFATCLLMLEHRAFDPWL